MSVSRTARRSPIPTQLNGRTIVYGSWYCSQRALGEVLGRELLEAVGRDGRRRTELGAFRRREDRRRLVDHGRAHDDDPLEVAALVRRDRGVERRGQDPLVLGEQVVRELVEVADAADHRRGGHDLVAVGRQLGEQRDVLGVALDEPIARVLVVRLRQPAVLAEVVEPDDVMAGLEQLGHEVAVDEPGGAGHEDAHQVSRVRVALAIPRRHRFSRSRSTCATWCPSAVAGRWLRTKARMGSAVVFGRMPLLRRRPRPELG